MYLLLCSLSIADYDRLATFYYTSDGKKATEQIWEETMNELRFAHVEEFIASMSD